MNYGIRLKIFFQKRNLSTVGSRPIVPYRKVIDEILYVLRTGDVNRRCYPKNTDLVLLVIAGFRSGIVLIYLKMLDKTIENL